MKTGTIAFNHSGAVTCRVHNISPAGACLEVESPVGIPQNFSLTIENESAPRRTRVMWKSQNRMGVAFH